MNKMRLLAVGFVFMLVGGGVLLGKTETDTNKTQTESRFESLAKLTKIIGTVEQYYVDDLTLSELIDKSIEGLISNLDAHSGYLDEKKYENLKVQTDGEFGGVGFTIGMKDGALTVIAPIEDTPADKAGLKSGDIILKINELSTLSMTLDEAVNLMRGEPKTEVSLTIIRKNENKPIVYNITRDIIKVQSVYGKIIENENILYLRVTTFDKNVESKTKEIFNKYKDKNVSGVILDLRNNPGGLLDQAVALTDLFIDEGIIVSQKGRDDKDKIEFKAKKGEITSSNMAILVNGGSASASEIVSGSLQDHKRAIVVGESTFGKGSVQAILPVDNESAIRLTIARYYLPSGRTIQATGVQPDVVVYPSLVPHSDNDFSIKEQDLKMHLESELNKMDNSTKKADTKDKNTTKENKDIITQTNVFNDLQLKTAIDVIRVLNLTTK